MKYIRYKDIPKLNQASWRTAYPLANLEERIQDLVQEYGLDLEPEYQRGYVWTQGQQIAYVEHILRGGQGSSKEITFNMPGWGKSFKGPMEIVDGKQRLNACLAFLRDEIPAYGSRRSEYEDRLPSRAEVVLCIADLENREDLLQWYIDLNSGGTIHTQDELDRVRDLIKAIKGP